jgi:hypothetical protein
MLHLSSASSLFVLTDKLVFHTLALVICGISPHARLVRNIVRETMDGCFRLSLSTTFGGSPVTALSPFCLLVANVNTLMAQFLFVFLSGAGEFPYSSLKNSSFYLKVRLSGLRYLIAEVCMSTMLHKPFTNFKSSI